MVLRTDRHHLDCEAPHSGNVSEGDFVVTADGIVPITRVKDGSVFAESSDPHGLGRAYDVNYRAAVILKRDGRYLVGMDARNYSVETSLAGSTRP